MDKLLTQQKETAHFQFFYGSGDEQAISEMAQKLEENYERITQELQSKDQPRVKAKVYPNLKAYHAATGNPNADNWMVGSCWGADEFRLVSPNNPGPDHTYQSVLQGAVHEFTHCVHEAIAQSYQSPKWLSESIACFEANQFVNPATLAYIRKGEYPSLARMNEDKQQGYAYQLGYVVIEYVKQTWGMQQVVELLRAGGDLEAVLGIGEKQFEQGFYEFVKTNYLNTQR